MDRVATDVAASPPADGELPSFEELLAEGSFQARLARARAEREKTLSDAGPRSDDFILNTSRKPWEKAGDVPRTADPLVRALGASAAVEKSVVHPFPTPPRAAEGNPTKSAKGVGAPRELPETVVESDPLALGGPVAAPPAPVKPARESGPIPLPARQAVARAMKDRATTGGNIVPLADAMAGRAAALLPEIAEASEARKNRVRRKRGAMVVGGFAAGLALGIGAATLPGLLRAPHAGDVTAALTVAPAPARPAASAVAAGTPATPLRDPVVTAAVPAALPVPAEGMPLGAMPALSDITDTAALRALPAVAPPDAVPAIAVSALRVPTLTFGAAVLSAPGVTDRGLPALPGGTAGPGIAGAFPPVLATLSPMPGDPALGRQASPAAFVPQDTPESETALPAAPAFEGVIVVHAPDSVSEEAFLGVLSQLEDAGYPLGESSRVNFTISSDNVRYFHAADAAAATALAAELGAKARDFTTFRPSPPEGTVEVWLSGRGSAPAVATKRTAGTRRAPAADPNLQNLRNRILQQLRNGDHL